MILFRLMVFNFMLVKAAFALQIEAPQEIAEHISIYAKEAGGENENAILKASITKNMQCNTFALQLIDKNTGKTRKKIELCSTDLPNSVLQNAVFELFGHKNLENSKNYANSALKTAIIGAGFIAAGVLLYYSNPPKPVYGGKK